MSCGHAHTVGLLPVFGAFSMSSYSRGLSLLCPSDSMGMPRSPAVEGCAQPWGGVRNHYGTRGCLRWSYRVAHLTCPQHPNKLSLNSLASQADMATKSAGSAPDRDVDRGLEAGRRYPGGRRPHQLHRLWRAEEPAQRARGGAAPLPLEQGGVPALLGRQPGQVDEGQVTAAQLVGDQVLDGGRDPRPVGGGRPGGSLAREDADIAVRNAEAAQQPARL